MTTKLEAMVGLLAGRKVDPAILDELDDPTSEASRFLEATRARSRALLRDSAEPGAGSRPSPTGASGTGRTAQALYALAILILVGSGLLVVDRRFRVMEAGLALRDQEARASASRLEWSLARLAESNANPRGIEAVEAALKRIEDVLKRQGEKATKPNPVGPDPVSESIRDESARHSLELSAKEKAEVRRLEEIQATIHDAARVLRLLLERSQPPMEPNPATTTPRFPGPGDPRRPIP